MVEIEEDSTPLRFRLHRLEHRRCAVAPPAPVRIPGRDSGRGPPPDLARLRWFQGFESVPWPRLVQPHQGETQ
jgi:hypothetical protein